MEVYLCGKGHCPRVVTTQDGVEIGEEGNSVKLGLSEWNVLVERIKEGKLGRL